MVPVEAKKSLIVNLFGAPGAGKSTIRAGLFYLLKINGYNAEEVVEFAKDLVWEKRELALACQPYVFGKQLKNIERLMGQVDVIITDSPILLSSFYVKGYPESFHKLVLDQFKAMDSVNYFINRVKPYQKKGRIHSDQESDELAVVIKDFLDYNLIRYEVVDGDEDGANWIFNDLKHFMVTKTLSEE